MDEKQILSHALMNVWKDYPEIISNDTKTPLQVPAIETLIMEFLSLGKFYYYVLNFTDNSLSHHHANILKMHGLKKFPQSLHEILALIHPDDLAFVLEAERASLEKARELDAIRKIGLKSSFCFRMLTGNGDYQLFHHQSIQTSLDVSGKLAQCINIHTNIQHLAAVNNYIVVVSGIGEFNDFYPISIPGFNDHKIIPHTVLTNREREVLNYLSKGYSSNKISEILYLSPHTIKTHRKNILKKTNTSNTSEMITRCLEMGIL